MSIRINRRLAGGLALISTVASMLASTTTPAAASTIPAGGIPVEGATLDWSGNVLMQSPLYGMFRNYFSAGVSTGSEATYKGSEGAAAVYLEAEGSEKVATWATHENYGPEAGRRQVVHLSKGVGRIEADGSAKVTWDATYSVNFYSGAAPFSVEDPTLTVNPDGTGALTATMLGCESSQANPSECTPFAPVPNVQVATFSGARVDPEAPLTVDPDYAGVAVSTEGAQNPQNRMVEGWGSWPQSMVNFQIKTGLSSYWYSDGDPSDPEKPPLPFVVDFKAPKQTPPSPSPAKPSPAPPGATPSPVPGKLSTLKGVQKLGSDGIATVAKLDCPTGGATCTAAVRKHVGTRIAGKRYLLGVLAPKRIPAGKSASVRVHLPEVAQEALGGESFLVKLKVALQANGLTTQRVLKVKVAGRN